MGRPIRSIRAGTREQLDRAAEQFGYPMQVWDAEVYITQNGDLFVVAPEVWVDYFQGRSGLPLEQNMPDIPFEFDEKQFQDLIRGV